MSRGSSQASQPLGIRALIQIWPLPDEEGQGGWERWELVGSVLRGRYECRSIHTHTHTHTLSLSLFFFFLVFRDRVSLYSPGCPGAHSVDQAGLELRNPPASASRVLGIKACATMPGYTLSLIARPFTVINACDPSI
jgi:hypothetical protein